MIGYLVGALALGALCTIWVLVQRWVYENDPDIKGPESGGSGGCGGCGGGHCATRRAEAVEEAADVPRACAREARQG